MMSAAIPEQGNGKIANPLARAVEVIEARATVEAKTTEQGLDTPIGGTGAQPSDNNYSVAIRGLIDLYSDVENSSFSLPAFSALPLGVFLWSLIKFEIAILGDLLLFIPINLVIFVRNIFPGRWRYRSWSWKYIKYVGLYWWRGDWYPLSIFVRPLTKFLLSSHFRRRLLAVKRRLLLDRKIDPHQKENVLFEVDNALTLWESPTAISILFTYILPTVGPVMALWGRFVPSDLPSWVSFIVYASISYAFAILATAFLVKRGLMLGGTGRSAYFPGALERSGAYAEEKKILDMFGVAMREVPIDIVVFIIGIIFSLLFINMQYQFTEVMNDWINHNFTNWTDPELIRPAQISATRSLYMQFGVNLIIAILMLGAWRRRIGLQRA